MILPISTSQVTRITDLNHHTQLNIFKMYPSATWEAKEGGEFKESLGKVAQDLVSKTKPKGLRA
jgi:hypothetical protein